MCAPPSPPFSTSSRRAIASRFRRRRVTLRGWVSGPACAKVREALNQLTGRQPGNMSAADRTCRTRDSLIALRGLRSGTGGQRDAVDGGHVLLAVEHAGERRPGRVGRLRPHDRALPEPRPRRRGGPGERLHRAAGSEHHAARRGAGESGRRDRRGPCAANREHGAAARAGRVRDVGVLRRGIRRR